MKETFTTTRKLPDATYVPPKVEVTDILLEQNVLDSGSGNISPMPGEAW